LAKVYNLTKPDIIMENAQELSFANELTEHVLANLSGTHPKLNELKLSKGEMPSKRIILGNLCSIDRATEDLKNQKKTSVNTNSFSISFLLESFNKVKIKSSFYVYFSRDGELFKRYFSEPEECRINKSESDKEIEYNLLRNTISKEENIELEKVPEWKAKIRLETKSYTQKGKKLNLITIFFENITQESTLKVKQDFSMFNPSIEIYLEKEPHPFLFEYRYEDYPESYETFFQCNNCSAKFDKEQKVILTENYKRFYQKQIYPKNNLVSLEGEEIELNFSSLVNVSERNTLLEKISLELNNYLSFYEENRPNITDKGFKKYSDSLGNFIELIEKFNKGVELLKNNSLSSEAFRLLQLTFLRSSKYSSWRLFQLIFIINNLPSIVNETERDIAEVLHVDTGGGKSEAYFGLVVFSSFFDRLRGKSFGITGITKFPLRMLSIQQLERVANIFIWAEEIRLEEKILGEPFSVAYFVGNSSKDFPRYNQDLIESLSSKKVPGKIIKTCPICNEKTIFLKHKQQDSTIVHHCDSCKREFYLYLTDEEVFRKLPTFIVATVDKFSGISMNRRYRNLFGGKIYSCNEGHGFFPSGDKCEANNNRCKSNTYEQVRTEIGLGSTIIIQDEMHLIREGFGTIDSHFETLMEALQEEFTKKTFKNIAMTATISGAKKQISQLYTKKTRVFPGQSPLGKGYKDFFFDRRDEKVQRILVGLKPNGQENRKAINITLKIILDFIRDVEENKKSYCEKLHLNENVLEEIIGNYKSYLTYHLKKDDVESFLGLYSHIEREDYFINPLPLTGELSLDEIRDLILKVTEQDTRSTKELFNVSATNVVSHGVDIEKWNLMCFQGMPRSTAEYIQSLSRVGRKHIGIVFVWFYPNRVRDLSFFNKFEEYHEKIEHHVTPVPILRWAKLGFYQTFNSLFCASILSFFSNKENKPLYAVEEVNKIFSGEDNLPREGIITFLKKAYKLDKDVASSTFFRDSIEKEVEARFNFLQKYVGSKKNFFPEALKDSGKIYFKNQLGMRGIQKEVVLKPSFSELNFIKNFNSGGDSDE
jgi:hypothetical protein